MTDIFELLQSDGNLNPGRILRAKTEEAEWIIMLKGVSKDYIKVYASYCVDLDMIFEPCHPQLRGEYFCRRDNRSIEWDAHISLSSPEVEPFLGALRRNNLEIEPVMDKDGNLLGQYLSGPGYKRESWWKRFCKSITAKSNTLTVV